VLVGNVSNDGNADVTERGVCWGTSTGPTTVDNSLENGSGTGVFTSKLIGLTRGTKYYVRAYAINSEGTSYGNEVSFTTTSIIDLDGNVYTSVIIGEKEWMVENLLTTKYSDGTSIPNVTNNDEWSNLSTGAWSHYDNDSQYDSTYGKLYNWYAVETGKLCPLGWRVPLNEEMIGGGVPGGLRSSTLGNFAFNRWGYWWSFSQQDNSYAWAFTTENDQEGRTLRENRMGLSVRCIKINFGE
jgi:hypothetical protein